jgi:dCMP deaminase
VLRPSWDEYFLGIAEAVAARADCSRRKIGAVIVKNNRIVSTGYNGAPAGHRGCLEGACPRATSDVPQDSSYDTGPGTCIAVHAEANALLYADRDKCEGATMYITDMPCDGCMKLIHASGIRKIYAAKGNAGYMVEGLSVVLHGSQPSYKI